MKIVIEIPNWLYNAMMEWREPHYSKSLGDAVRDGTPLPEHHGRLIDKRGAVTNGDVIKAVFPNLEPIKKKKDTTTYILEPSLVLSPSMIVFDSWWNSPYKECDKE